MQALKPTEESKQLVKEVAESIENLNRQFREFESKPDEIEKPVESNYTLMSTLIGGKYVSLHSVNFDLIINILICMRRTISNLAEAPGTTLEDRHFRKKIVTENDWVSSSKNDE